VPSSLESEDFDNISIDSSSGRYNFISKRSNLMQKIKSGEGARMTAVV
jgi:hypothetical protein